MAEPRPLDREDIARRIREGQSLEQIGAAVHMTAKHLGTRIRQMDGMPPVRRGRTGTGVAVDMDRARNLLASGKTHAEAAARLGISIYVLRDRLRRAR